MSQEMLISHVKLGENGASAERVRERVPVLVAGLPGKMATLVAESLLQDDRFDLLPYALTSKRNRDTHLDFGNRRINLIDYFLFEIKRRPGAIAVDFTNPLSAVTNSVLYTEFKVPFVMGTTVSDCKQIEEIVKNSQISAVVAPNMAAPVIDVQDAIKFLGRQMKTGSRGQVFSMADVLGERGSIIYS